MMSDEYASQSTVADRRIGQQAHFEENDRVNELSSSSFTCNEKLITKCRNCHKTNVVFTLRKDVSTSGTRRDDFLQNHRLIFRHDRLLNVSLNFFLSICFAYHPYTTRFDQFISDLITGLFNRSIDQKGSGKNT